jgi:hypothetical protein
VSNVEAVKLWRKNLKKRAITLFGGKCLLCGYDKCIEALEFHHIEPEHKDIGIGKIYSNPKSWDKVVNELKKCILVCANCHREIHYNNITIEPKNYIVTLEVDYKLTESDNYHKCICGVTVHNSKKFCSPKCDKKNRRRINWDSEKDNILRLKDIENKPFVAIASIYGTSDNTIRKWYYRFKENSPR